MKMKQVYIPFYHKLRIIAILGFFLFPVFLAAQDRKSGLRQEKKQIEADIKYTNQLLSKTRENRRSSMDGLVILQQRIRQRERLINTIKAELILLDNEIIETGDSIFGLTVELKKLKEEYAQMIYYANRNRSSYNRLVFVFSARDFNQAYRRIKYFQQYGAYRRTQAELITSTQDKLSIKELELEQQKAEKQSLLAQEHDEKQQLENEKGDVDHTIQDLGQKEKELKAALRAKQKAVAELEKAIEKIIAEEIKLAEERARARAGTTTSSGFALTPEEKQLSENFTSNKGKLPWPTERGIVSSTFGEHQHPVLPRVKIKNNGIDILTGEGEYARAVFNGEVTRVISVPNFNNVVIVRHGEFLTVYSNLDEVMVSKGQKITTKQRIGRIYTDHNENRTKLHFEIWKAKDLMNPSSWLAGKR
ncbi:MAG: peptidoglycan DD-metalloendopeptidase family protein [Bacteroidales bacterium]|nr:peptidoglycan DD-metalloendopeptidase family protein [Bacteroidales bacterium]